MTTALLSPASALIAHIEPLVSDRRILVVGNAEHSLVEHLLDRGARLIQFLDPDARRVAHAAAHNSERRVTYAQLTESSLRDGSFELAIVEDANLADNLDKLVSGLRRTMNNRGLAVICATNPDSSTGLLGVAKGTVDYTSLAETAEDLFESVLMLGQSPFLGYSVVHFDLDHPPEPALDNAYLNQEGETPDFYIAICGSAEATADLDLEEMSIVQLPAARFVENSEQIHREKERRAARRVESLEADLKAAQSRGSDREIERLTRELEQRDTWIKKLESRSEAADARADDAENDLEELEKELEETHKALLAAQKDNSKKRVQANKELELEVATLTTALKKAQASADEAKHQSAGREALEEEVEELHEETEQLHKTVKKKSQAIGKLEKRLSAAEKEIDELHDQLDETEDLLVAAKKESAQSKASEDAERDLRSLEEQLRERGEHIAKVEEQLRKLETYAKTLTAELTSKSANEGADQAQVTALAKALAEREADLVAAQWTIGQLKQSALKD